MAAGLFAQPPYAVNRTAEKLRVQSVKIIHKHEHDQHTRYSISETAEHLTDETA